MIEEPQLLQTKVQRTAVIPIVASWSEMREVMGPGIREVLAVIAAQGLTPAGPWFTHHRRRPTDTLDFEISVPVGAIVTPFGRVMPGDWPAMVVARTVYAGPYEGLAEAWREFHKWLEAKRHRTSDDL